MTDTWQEKDTLFEDAGDFGGDIQVGRSFSRRFLHAALPGRVVDIIAYSIEVEGPGDDEWSLTLECQQWLTVCRDAEDPGSTEVWSDSSYVDLPERFDGTYTTVELAERAARVLVASMEPYHIGWDGAPEITP